MTKDHAAKTAADSLERIEFWAAKTFLCSLACAGMLSIVTALVVTIGSDYVCAKMALAQASQELSSGLANVGKAFSQPTPPSSLPPYRSGGLP
jgi:hypothetical protein